jgi:hypothetical protein
LVRVAESNGIVAFSNDGFEVAVHRRPQPGVQPLIGLTATWNDEMEPVVLTEVRSRRG